MATKFTCQFTLDNDAFADDYALEAQVVLEALAAKVGNYATGGRIHDRNGNTIGSWKLR